MSQQVRYDIAEQQSPVELNTTTESTRVAEKSSELAEGGVDQTHRNIWGAPQGVDSLSQESSSHNAFKENVTEPSDFLGDSEEHIFPRRKMRKPLHWSLPWSDLMMTMFVFFVIMYVYHDTLREIPALEKTVTENGPVALLPGNIKNEPSEIAESDQISETYRASKEALKSQGLNSFATVDLIPNKAVRIILTSDLLFDSGKADLKPESEKTLKGVAHIIRETPYMINVVGHTDDLPIKVEQFPSNWELSTTRACKVARYFIEKANLPPERFYITGNSYFNPIKPNNGPQNRAINRRVEIVLTKEKPYSL